MPVTLVQWTHGFVCYAARERTYLGQVSASEPTAAVSLRGSSLLGSANRSVHLTRRENRLESVAWSDLECSYSRRTIESSTEGLELSPVRKPAGLLDRDFDRRLELPPRVGITILQERSTVQSDDIVRSSLT